MKLLTQAQSNSKTKKLLSEFNYEGAILHLAPAALADGKHSVCPWSTPGCRSTCLNTSGRGQITGDLSTETLSSYKIHQARIRKTLDFLYKRDEFIQDLRNELSALNRKAARNNKDAVVRLNGTSDIQWENYQVIDSYPDIQFYDYTKSYMRMMAYLDGRLPDNYYLIFSRSEATTTQEIKHIIRLGGNVTVVFRDTIPKKYLGIKVINGDEHDFRFRDKKGVIVGLKAKGRAKKDTTGFVV